MTNTRNGEWGSLTGLAHPREIALISDTNTTFYFDVCGTFNIAVVV